MARKLEVIEVKNPKTRLEDRLVRFAEEKAYLYRDLNEEEIFNLLKSSYVNAPEILEMANVFCRCLASSMHTLGQKLREEV